MKETNKQNRNWKNFKYKTTVNEENTLNARKCKNLNLKRKKKPSGKA